MTKTIRTVVFILLVFGVKTLSAQDIITLKDGREVKCKVTDVSDVNKVVKYKKADNPDGPQYSVDMKDIVKIKYANGSEEAYSDSSPAGNGSNNDKPGLFNGKFDIEDESIHDYLEGVAKNCGARILEKCGGRVDNYSTEIYWDQTYRDDLKKEINLAIIVKWEKGFEGKQRWVRGIVRLDETGRKIWQHQGDGGITFSGCAKSITEL